MFCIGFKSPSGDVKPNTGGLKADIKGGVGAAPPREKKIKIAN